ncbi:putative protein phosphatase 2C 39 [Senna tora]|uniref:PPM-type phosphatase domain-containing protein n=1 Tax=Senna tora TaxID=362788 RepID=A0A834SMQ6_9FABA|nr:putative protein phosphatase 2C 39 [Senna tora]
MLRNRLGERFNFKTSVRRRTYTGAQYQAITYTEAQHSLRPGNEEDIFDVLIHIGSHLGKRNAMEDHRIFEHKQIQGHKFSFISIFDGQMDHDVPRHLLSNLYEAIAKEPDFWTTKTKEVVSRAYRITDSTILEKAVELEKRGSTALTAILIDSRKLVIANFENSRAVICKNGVAKQLLVDHEPTIENEDIENRSDFVSNLYAHMVSEQNYKVRIADGSLGDVTGIGEVSLSDSITLKSVLFVPKLKCNLLSVAKLTHDSNCKAEFSNSSCSFQDVDSGKIIGNARVCNDLYRFEMNKEIAPNKESFTAGMIGDSLKEDRGQEVVDETRAEIEDPMHCQDTPSDPHSHEKGTTAPNIAISDACPDEILSPPIAKRKGVRTCTLHPISQFVSYEKLSPKFQAFVSNLDKEDCSLILLKFFTGLSSFGTCNRDVPFVTEEIIKHDSGEYLILTGDGLWEVMTNQEAVDCIKDMGANSSATSAAKHLAEEALKRRRSSDDTSCIDMKFHSYPTLCRIR